MNIDMKQLQQLVKEQQHEEELKQTSDKQNESKVINYENLNLSRMTSLNKINTDGQNYYITVMVGSQEMQINLAQFLKKQYQTNHNFVNYPPEQYYGNCEYKLKIVKVDQSKMQHRTTQMQFRLDEGKGVAQYVVGVEDDGTPTGIKQEDMLQSIQWLMKFANNNKAEIILMKVHQGQKNTLKIAEFMVRRRLQDSIKTDIRIVILGQKNSGKSSLVGMITTGQSNVGRQQFGGLFRQVVGFDTKGKVINKLNLLGQDKEDQYVVENATKIITFVDLIENEHQNLNEAMQDIQSQFPNYFLIVINAVQQMGSEFLQQLSLTQSQQIPIFIVITHADKLKDDYQLEMLLYDIRKKIKTIAKATPVILVRSTDDVMLFSKQILDQYEKETVIPVFLLSNLDAKSHFQFIQFLNQLPLKNELINNSTQPTEFGIHQTFELSFPKQVNDEIQENQSFTVEDSANKQNRGHILVQDRKMLILGGTVTKGIVKVGQTLLLGPDKIGCFYPIQVQNIQSNRVKVKSALSGQLCTIQFTLVNKYKANFGTNENPIRKGMVLVDQKLKPNSFREFEVNLQFFAPGQGVKDINEEKETKEKIYLTKTRELLIHTPYSKQICLICDTQQENFEDLHLQKQPSLTRKPSKSVDTKIHRASTDSTLEKQSKKLKALQKNSCYEIISGESLILKLRFKYQKEYLTQGMKIIIMEQKFSAFGHISQLHI